jgi:hypothetical protein
VLGEALVRSAQGGRGHQERLSASAGRSAAGSRGKAYGSRFTSLSRPASRRLPSDRDGRRGAGGVLPPFDFGQPLGHIGPLRIQHARPLKGGRGVGKLPRRETAIPMRKGLEGTGLRGSVVSLQPADNCTAPVWSRYRSVNGTLKVSPTRRIGPEGILVPSLEGPLSCSASCS